MAAGVPPPRCLLPGTNGWAAVCSLKLLGHQSSGVLIFLPSIDISLLEWKKKDVSRAFEKKKKNGWLLKTFCKGGKIARKRDLGGGWRGCECALVWRLFQLKPGAGVRGSVQTVTFSSRWLFCPRPWTSTDWGLFTYSHSAVEAH